MVVETKGKEGREGHERKDTGENVQNPALTLLMKSNLQVRKITSF